MVRAPLCVQVTPFSIMLSCGIIQASPLKDRMMLRLCSIMGGHEAEFPVVVYSKKRLYVPSM